MMYLIVSNHLICRILPVLLTVGRRRTGKARVQEREFRRESSGESDTDIDIQSIKPKFNSPILQQKKFIVFEESICDLMKFCKNCGSPVIHKKKSVVGSMLRYHITCHKGCSYTWTNQPNFLPHLPALNLIIAAAIVMTGNTFTKIKAFADAMNLACISSTTFLAHQKNTLIPVIQEQWLQNRSKIIEQIKDQQLPDEQLILAGDARCDSPGHNAKYGSYTLMLTTGSGMNGSGKIVAMEMVQVSEVKNSNQMEPVGLQRCLAQVLHRDKLNVSVLATDRHPVIRSIMKKEHPDIDHQFDIWHFSKSITKKLTAKSKIKECNELGPWIQSISNHLWWCCATCEGNAELLKEKWISLLHHITNTHSWLSNKFFHKCEHKKYSRQKVKTTKWLKRNSKAFKALEEVMLEKKTVKRLG